MPKPKKTAKKRPQPREGIERTRNGGQWTESRFVSFVKSALRGARWPQKYECIKAAFVEKGINPATGKPCKLHKCPECDGMFPQSGMQADHKIAVIGPEGFQTWDLFIERLYCEADGFEAKCKECHRAITKHENEQRRAHKAPQQP